jgi:hypothetical protein
MQWEDGFLRFDSGNFLSPLASDFVTSSSANFAALDLVFQVDPTLESRKFGVDSSFRPYWSGSGEGTGLGKNGIYFDRNSGWEANDRQPDLAKLDSMEKETIDAAGNPRLTGSLSLVPSVEIQPMPVESGTDGGTDILPENNADNQAVGPGQTSDSETHSEFQADPLQTNRSNPRQDVPHDVLPAAGPAGSNQSTTTLHGESALPGWMGLPVLAGNHPRYLRSRADDTAASGQSTRFAEGGIIEVDAAVTDTQQAYEAHLFAAVARMLDEHNFLAQPALPARQPPASELARAVAFELASFERTSPAPPLDSAYEPGTKAPARPTDDALPFDLGEGADSGLSRALAFAQWPLMISASAGAVHLVHRRRTLRGATRS